MWCITNVIKLMVELITTGIRTRRKNDGIGK